jgi:hypothetical protein
MGNKSKINEIAEQVWHHRKLEVEEYAINRAVALYNVEFDGKTDKFWLLNAEITPDRNVQYGLGGFANITGGRVTAIKNDGFPISKNSKMGGFLIQNKVGNHFYNTPTNETKNLTIFNNVKYIPHHHEVEALDLQFYLDFGKPQIINSLKELLGKIKKNEDDRKIILQEKEELISKGENIDDEVVQELLKKYEIIDKEYQQNLSKAKKFIRQNAELRSQPILDPWQEEIKRSNLYDKTIAIDGGPGTGKTTSLVQRIRFLTDVVAINEYLPNLSEDKKQMIINNSSWIFFSPSELLKLFLKNNMTSEGLNANDSNVFVWDTYKTILMKDYKLFNTETQNPFLNLKKFEHENILPINSKKLKDILKSFDDFYLRFQKEKIEKLIDLKISNFYWKEKGESIQKYLQRQEKINGFDSLIKIYFNLKQTYSESVKEIVASFTIELNKQTAKAELELKNKNSDVYDKFIILIQDWINNSKSVDEDEEEDFEIESEVESIVNIELKAFNTLKSYIRKKGLLIFDKGTKLTSREKEIDSLFGFILDFENLNINYIGQSAYFIKYFERSTKGIVSNLISDIPNLYKAFRRDELKKQTNKWDYKILKYIVEEDSEKNKRLHPNEKAFLMLFINNFIKSIHKNYKREYNSIKHPYLDGFINNSKNVIGVDEATDFHIIDLLAIQSLANPEISSVTYSGDLMQRLTEGGIRDWNDLKVFIKNFEVKNLQISYRQSPTLLEIAESIYQKATGKKSEYMSFMDKDDNEPKPLLYVNKEEDEILNWISKRIIEIYNSYGGFIPSIAIFLSNESELDSFSRKLGNLDSLSDLDIKVLACNNGQILGDKNTVRVFSIDYIKGLEFEAVFFHKIEDVFIKDNKEQVLKNLYVGLSRASFYLGVTSREKSLDLIFLNEYFEIDNPKWNL